MNEKRLEQLKEAWIKNVMRILNWDREAAEKAYKVIQPYRLI